MRTKTCPACNKENFIAARVCACGFDFIAAKKEKIKEEKKAEKPKEQKKEEQKQEQPPQPATQTEEKPMPIM